MKKITMLMAAATVALAANADTWQLHGQMTGQSNWESVELTQNGDWWEYSSNNFVAGQFGLKKNNNWYGGGGLTITEANHEYTFDTSKGNSTCKLAGSYTFRFNPSNNAVEMVPFTGTIVDKITYAIHGQITGNSSWESTDMTEGEDGVWSITKDFVAGAFGVKKNVNGSQKAWYAYSALGTPADNCESNGDDGNIKLTKAGNYTISFNPNGDKITVKFNNTVTPPSDENVVYAIHGQITGNSNWESTDLTKGEDGVWSITEDFVAGAFGVKQVTDGKQSNWYAYSALGTPADNCESNGSDGNIKLTKAGNYTISFNPADNTITVKFNDNGEEPETPETGEYDGWYVNLNGDYNNWQNNGVQLTDGNTIAKWENIKLGNGEFEIKIWNGSSDVYYGDQTNAIVAGNWQQLYQGGGHAKVQGAQADDIFTVEYNVADNKIKLTLTSSTSVSTIEASNSEAVYFNMQGVRVANPENGLFIRVQNGKAVKVVK